MVAAAATSCALDGGPQSQIDRYVAALVQGSAAAALDVWPEPPPTTTVKSALLAQRRASETRRLVGAGIRSYQIVRVEWWRTCCEPGILESSAHAGMLRAMVDLAGDGGTLGYVFDVRAVHDGGDPNSFLPPRWVLRDVYPRGKSPIEMPWVRTGAGSCSATWSWTESPVCPVGWPPEP